MNRSIRFIVFIGFAFFLGYYVGTNKISYEWKNYKPQISVVNKEPPKTATQLDLSLLWTVLDKVENQYYDKSALDANKLLYGAITGMVQSLGDPYTLFLPPVQNADFKQGLAGQFEGIGAELGMHDKQIVVVAPLDGSPALKAGVKTGDIILKVGGQSVDGWTLAQTVEKIRGPKGTEVMLTIVHKGENKSTDVRIVRDTVTVKSATGWVKKVKEIDKITQTDVLKKHPEDKILYTRLSQFGDNTNKEWLGMINNLYLDVQADHGIKGVILDLRNNPGGYLSDAAFIASEFLKDGVVVIQDKGINGEKTPFTVVRKGLLTDLPVVALINKGSASASEIVAGALREHGRAKLVGETSFGKGTIQQAEDLGNGAGIHITIARWLTPNENWINGKGLTPDVSVALNEKEQDRDTQLEKAVEVLVQ